MMSRLHWDHKTDFHKINIGTLLTTVQSQLLKNQGNIITVVFL